MTQPPPETPVAPRTPTPRAPGARRSAARARRGRLGVTTVLAVVVPLLTLGAIALAHPENPSTSTHPPTTSDLTASTVVCPSAIPGADTVGLSSVHEGASGQVTVRRAAASHPVPVRQDRVTVVTPGDGPVVVDGADALAPALLGARWSLDPLAVSNCRTPSSDQWFTGLGAGATHSSVVELVNPNPGPATADLEVYAGSGLLTAPRLLGVAVPGGESRTLDLATLIPRRGDLTLHVTTVRGRLAVDVQDTYRVLGGGATSSDWLDPQPAPQTTNLLLGLPPGGGTRSLLVANSGDSDVTATLRLVTAGSTFVPEGSDPIQVPAQTTVRVSVSKLLASAAADGAVGVEVDGTGPVTASLRSFVDSDLTVTTADTSLAEPGSVALPIGRKRLVLGGADAVGAATVTAYAADGTQLITKQVALSPKTSVLVGLPPAAQLVTVAPARTTVVGAVLLVGGRGTKATSHGAAVVPLDPLLRSGQVPFVGPGVP